MLHQHPRQLLHQHLTLKNKFINFKNYKKQKNIIKKKKKNGGTDLQGLTQNKQMNTSPDLNITTHTQIFQHFLAISCQPNTKTHINRGNQWTQGSEELHP